MKKITVSHKDLNTFCKKILIRSGIPENDAVVASNVLIEADLRGYSSHGVARLPVYLELIENGRINKSPLVHESKRTKNKAVGNVNGDNGLGLIVAHRSMEIAIKKAKSHGIGCVAVSHSNHYGIAQYASLMATKKNMVGISMTNTSACVSHNNGKGRLLGTNPMAITLPYKNKPFISDFSSPVVSYGKLQIAQFENKNIPDGWAIDSNGNNSNDPYIIEKSGTLLPLGSDVGHSDYKGMCLGVSIDALCSLLSGAAFLSFVPHFVAISSHIKNLDENISSRGSGHFFIAIDIDAFREYEDYQKDIEVFINTIKSTEPRNKSDKVYYPGEIDHLNRKKHIKNGIPIYHEILKNLDLIGKKFDLNLINKMP
ncbi:Ldh family oxidoreductase [Candidatus Pseudothioglobus singularis]|nr:Ldh family oxidoreductase [Candidatus Pseudothioglobus singularis]